LTCFDFLNLSRWRATSCGMPGDYAAALPVICCNLSETDEFDSQ
jgi:hypothetical protein